MDDVSDGAQKSGPKNKYGKNKYEDTETIVEKILNYQKFTWQDLSNDWNNLFEYFVYFPLLNSHTFPGDAWSE